MKSCTICTVFLLLNLDFFVVHSQQFSVSVEVPAIMLEGFGQYHVNFKQQTGNPTCSFTAKKPDETVVAQATKDLNSMFESHTIQYFTLSSFTEDFILTFSFTCVKLLRQLGDAICSLTQPDSAIAITDYSGSTDLRNDNMEITVTKTGSQESLLMLASCSSGGKTFNTDIPVYFSVGAPSPWASATGDPHFAQNVIDKSSMSTKQICYDVTGQMGDFIYIAGFYHSGIKVFGQLKDD
ncbi:DgyrCDS14487 [Dimorphilus gyrociliatus]|uniref:DgyrCDS14487 n=1 Tax=Dimorphilus gyrociliatus TaxID=2664684 RepID=A0A7I8WDR2_9ANNE|nr:DgyrCDS14487 [Dimorphilus gyrociliatus]